MPSPTEEKSATTTQTTAPQHRADAGDEIGDRYPHTERGREGDTKDLRDNERQHPCDDRDEDVSGNAPAIRSTHSFKILTLRSGCWLAINALAD
jgi:hypothetical protein